MYLIMICFICFILICITVIMYYPTFSCQINYYYYYYYYQKHLNITMEDYKLVKLTFFIAFSDIVPKICRR